MGSRRDHRRDVLRELGGSTSSALQKAPDPPGTRGHSTQRDVAHELLTIKEAAAAMRVGLSLGYQLAHEYLNSGGTHGLPVLRFGTCMRVPRRALEELITCPPDRLHRRELTAREQGPGHRGIRVQTGARGGL